ncbi:MAG: SCO family protein [Vicinamibacterales bacterium]
MAYRWFNIIPGIVVALIVAGCGGPAPERYTLTGQVVAIGEARDQLTVKQQDIPGFMPAMMMGYRVSDPKLVNGLSPGDFITASLVVDGSNAYLSAIHKTGHGALPSDAHPIRVLDAMQPGDVVPDDALTDQTGAEHRLSDWRGRALAVTFVYTRCPFPTFCPLMDSHFQELQHAIKADAALKGRVHLVSISFDPAHDTPEVIKAHAAMRGADPSVWTYATGTPAAIAHLTSRFGVSAKQVAGELITHNLRTAIVGRDGRLVTIYSGNDWTVAAVLGDLRKASGV